MARRDPVENRAAADLAALYWWRRDNAEREDTEAAPPSEPPVALAERAAPTMPRIADLPGSRLRANAAARRAREAQAPKEAIALDPELVAAIRCERRSALLALAIGLIATAASMAAAVCAAIMREPVALGFAIAGGFAASLALYHAARWFLMMRADAPPNLLA